MSGTSLELYFAGDAVVQLVQTKFVGNTNKSPAVSVRGKTAGAFKNVGTFQWTSAVRAFCILCLKAIIASKDKQQDAVGQIVGFKGSLAASLDYAISKQPSWLSEMFGLDNNGQAFAKRLVVRTNPERKRPGPVILGLNDKAITADSITITWNGASVTTTEKLQALMTSISNGEDPAHPEQLLTSLLQKIAA